MIVFGHTPEKYCQSERLIQIERYVNAVISRQGAFPRHWSARQRRDYCDSILRELPHLLLFYAPRHEYSEHIEAFWHACEKLGLLDCGYPTWMVGQLLLPGADSLAIVGELEERIIEFTHGVRFQRRASDRRYEQKEKQERLEEYSRDLLGKYARALILRVDLAYYRNARVDIAEAYHHLDMLRLLINKRLGLFENLMGFVWCMEQGGKEGGYHLHLVLVFPGHMHQRDGYLIKQLAALWKQITGGLGRHYSCNANKAQYASRGILGIGMVYRNDADACENAVNAMGYLAEPEKEGQFLRMKPVGRRILGSGTLDRSSWQQAVGE